MKTRASCLAALRAGPTYLLLPAVLWTFAFGWANSCPGDEAALVTPRHKVQVRESALGAQIVAQGGKLIADYGGYQLYDAPQLPSGSPSGADAEVRDEYNLIQLHAVKLDTTKPETQALRSTVGGFQGKRLHLVQFAGPVQPAWREDLIQAGVQIVTFVPENAFLVYGDAQSIARLQALAATAPHVQWDGAYLNDYKINPRARTVDALGQPRAIGTDLFAVQLVQDAAANAGTLKLLDQVKLEPIKRQHAVLGYLNVVLRVAPENLAQIAAQPEVVSIQPYFVPKKMDERQDQIVAGNLTGNLPSGPGYLAWLASKGFTQAQFTSSGFAADVSDSGVDDGTTVPNHPGLYVQGSPANASRVIYNRLEGFPNPGSTLHGCDGHGTLNAHIIGGYDNISGFPYADNAGYHYGLGVCPFVRLGSSVIFDDGIDFTFPDYTDLQSRAYNNGARVSNNSWGESNSGGYTIDSQEYDSLVRDAEPASSPFPAKGNQEMVIVFAAGNAGIFGPQSVGAPGTAKNVITVGAGENVQPFGGADGSGIDDSGADNANDIIFFSSRGPCSDGRHKPDIMAPGTHVSGGVAQDTNPGPDGTPDPCFTGSGVSGGPNGSHYWPEGQQLFTASSGTSHSTPCVVGGCALVRQYFINNFDNPPSPAMTKAYLMNSARYMTGESANDNLWSDNQGMGEMNLGTAFDDTPRILRDELATDLFTASGQVLTFTNVVADTNKPMRVTLAWTDAPGNTTGAAYHNNLDLTVTVGGVTYRGNVFSGAFSAPGGSADTKNNVESVFLPPGASGRVVVAVTAANINSDGVPNNASPMDQDFALVVYNGSESPPIINSLQPGTLMILEGQPANFTVSASGKGSLSYQWQKNGAPLAGATNSIYGIGAATTNDAAVYSVVVASKYGSTLSPDATLTVIPTVPLAFALNNSNLTWTTDITNNPWYGQTTLAHDNVAAGKSYFIDDNQQTVLTSTTNGPGTLTFWWKVSSETNADILSFTSLGGGLTNSMQISGEVDWQQIELLLPAGPQDFEWIYAKNGANSAGSDAAWLDQISFVSGPTLPSIQKQPLGASIFAASPVSFNVAARGTPPLTYQWRLNGADVPGATGSTLSLANPSITDGGTYSVRVANAYGQTNSTDASLAVVPLVARGDNSLGQINVSLLTTNAVAIAGGTWHSLILRLDGSLYAFGDDFEGQIDVPANLNNALAIAAGGYHSLAVRQDGTVAAWGADDYGQTDVPAGLSNVIAVAGGTWHSLALRADGTVVAWGDDSLGQTDVPAGLAHVTAIAAGGGHSMALLTNGTVVAWGDNYDASGNFAGQSVVPFDLTNVVAIGAGDYHSLAVKGNGRVVAWGDDSEGQCDTPAGSTNVAAIVGGGAHTVALNADGTVAAWGNDWNGQCDLSPSISNVVAIAAGYSHTMLLEANRGLGPQLVRPARSRGQFSLELQTFAGRNYALEYKTNLSSSAWSPAAALRGIGGLQFLTDPAATNRARFYRVRQY